MLIEPEHLALPNSFAEHLPKDAGMGWPEDNAWVRLSAHGNCHLLGMLARDDRVFPNLKIQKWKIATPKILGATGSKLFIAVVINKRNFKQEFFFNHK